MTEDTPVIQLGTYTFDKFNVLDPNMYSSSAENISAFSNGMAAVADLNSKTNHLLQRIHSAEEGDLITINIDLSYLNALVSPSIQIMVDLITSASLVRLARLGLNDFKHLLMYKGEKAAGLPNGLASLVLQQPIENTAGLFLNSLSVSFDYFRVGKPTQVESAVLSLTGLLNPTSMGFRGFLTASVSNVPDNFFIYSLNTANFGVLVGITELILN
jgi:hypothetical protein